MWPLGAASRTCARTAMIVTTDPLAGRTLAVAPAGHPQGVPLHGPETPTLDLYPPACISSPPRRLVPRCLIGGAEPVSGGGRGGLLAGAREESNGCLFVPRVSHDIEISRGEGEGAPERRGRALSRGSPAPAAAAAPRGPCRLGSGRARPGR